MSIPIPLSVRLTSSKGSRHITTEISDLTMRWTDPGGYASLQVTLDRPLSLTPDELEYFSAVTVFDTRTGATVWDGRLEEPGRSASDNGHTYQIAAVGGQAHTTDEVLAVVYVDNPLSHLLRTDSSAFASNTTTGQPEALMLSFPQGSTLTTNSRIAMRYTALMSTGQMLARFDYTWDAGRTDANFAVQAVTRTNGSLSGGENARSQTWNTAGGASDPKEIDVHFPGTRNTVEFRIIYTGVGGPVGDSNHWATISDMKVRGTIYTMHGFEDGGGAGQYSTNWIEPWRVVEDVIGRFLFPWIDDEHSTIDRTSTLQIDQLAYHEGVDARHVLTDLMTLDAGYTWRIWERTWYDHGPQYRFEWVPIPVTVRYEADIVDGYDSSGSAGDLYNQVTVFWRDALGQSQATTVFADSPILDALDRPNPLGATEPYVGLTRSAQLDLGDEVGSTAAATRAGEQWLLDRTQPANAGRLRIARPIIDHESGRMVQPWEIRPGLIRVRGIEARADALNTTTRDGVAVFRILACEYSASDGAATLELDSYPPSMAATVAELQAEAGRPSRRRRWRATRARP